MKQEYVNAFLTPAALVWSKELNHDLKLVGAESVSHQFTTEDVTAIIGVSGSLQGNGYQSEVVDAVNRRWYTRANRKPNALV